MITHDMVRAISERQQWIEQMTRVPRMLAHIEEANKWQDVVLVAMLAAPLEALQAIQRILDQQAAFTKALRGPAIYLPEPIVPDMGLANLSFDVDLAAEDEEDAADLGSEPPRRQIGFRLHSTEDEEKKEDEPPAAG